MDSKTQGFLNVTDAAEGLVESLSEFKERAQGYLAAEVRLEESRASSAALTEAATRMATDMSRAVQLLDELGVPEMRVDVSRLVQTAALQGAQLNLQNDVLEGVRAVQVGERETLATQAASLDGQREAILRQAERLASYHSMLVEQQQRLLDQRENLSAIDQTLRGETEQLDRVNERLGTQTATLHSLATRLKILYGGLALVVLLAIVNVVLAVR